MDLLTRPSFLPEPPVIEEADPHRVAAGRSAIIAAAHARGLRHAIADEAVTDLLTDLRHFCAARRIDFDRCNRFAVLHFEAEIEGGQR